MTNLGSAPVAGTTTARTERHVGTTQETKPSFKTSEFYVWLLVSLAILIASAVVDNGDDGSGFGASSAWFYIALVTVGYLVSRGLAKAGSHSHSDDNR